MEQGLDPRSCLQIDCTDISRDAWNMSYIQLAALDLQGIVRHGNTLSGEVFQSRPTPQLRYFDQWLREQQSWNQLELLRELIVNPNAFFSEAEAEANRIAQNSASIEPVVSPELPENQAEQPCLFDLETMDTFAAPKSTERKHPKPRADITLPVERQMDLFGNDSHEL